jgi:class 3 adenylate cyclase
MHERRLTAQAHRTLSAPPPIAWALLSDSNRWDRAFGFEPATYRYEDVPARARVGRSRLLGAEVRWTERGEFVEGRSLWDERVFLEGPIAIAGRRYSVVPVDGGVASAVAVDIWLDTAPSVPRTTLQTQMQANLDRYLDALDVLLRAAPIAADPDEPPLATARRLMLLAAPDPFLFGVHTPPSAGDLAYRVAQFAAAPVDAQVRERLIALARDRPDDELRQVRPYELAGAWGLGRRAVLHGFLHAARAGLYDLHWQLDCPACRAPARVVPSLAAPEVAPRVHCDECDIGFDLDFADNVEAVFSVSPSVRRIEPALWCAGSPWFRPHQLGVVRVAPGATREERATLPLGELALRAQPGAATRRARVVIGAARPASVEVRVTADGMDARASADTVDGETCLRVINDGAEPVTVLIERAGKTPDVVTGAAILTQPEFLDLFGTEAPAVGMELSVGSLTVLFSDLTGITALYEQIGDARAFALVQAHFAEMARVVAAHEGAVVKTMGDAVMAAFTSPARALAGALEMCGRVDGPHRLRVGLYEGPCLLVRANDRLDLFGRTVNLAARLHGLARGGQIVLVERLLGHAEVEAVVRARGLAVERFVAQLKGVREPQALCTISLYGPPPSSTFEHLPSE